LFFFFVWGIFDPSRVLFLKEIVPRASLFLVTQGRNTHTERHTRDTYVHIYIFPDSLGIWNELRFGNLIGIDCSIWTFFLEIGADF
jgi:hypothetical protein